MALETRSGALDFVPLNPGNPDACLLKSGTPDISPLRCVMPNGWPLPKITPEASPLTSGCPEDSPLSLVSLGVSPGDPDGCPLTSKILDVPPLMSGNPNGCPLTSKSPGVVPLISGDPDAWLLPSNYQPACSPRACSVSKMTDNEVSGKTRTQWK